MKPQFRLSLMALSVGLLIVPAAYYSSAAPPTPVEAAEPAKRIIPGVPAQASHAHNIRLRIITITPVEDTDKTRLLKLEVERYYGKITTAALNRAKRHETMRFTILFPASSDADIRPGDLINYWLVGYTPMDGNNVSTNR